jgi:hypothetical protein
LAEDWSTVGTKLELLNEIHEITRIDKHVLQFSDPFATPIAERMSWAAHREVTKEEDTAYCLLGLFDVNMPLLYGEGTHKAFLRLQEEMFKRGSDQTIFLFTNYAGSESNYIPLLGDSPTMFCRIVDCALCPKARLECFPRDISYTSLKCTDLATFSCPPYPFRRPVLASSRPDIISALGKVQAKLYCEPFK